MAKGRSESGRVDVSLSIKELLSWTVSRLNASNKKKVVKPSDTRLGAKWHGCGN